MVYGIAKKKVSIRTDEIDILVNYYKDIYNDMINENKPRRDLINLWYECLKRFTRYLSILNLIINLIFIWYD